MTSARDSEVQRTVDVPVGQLFTIVQRIASPTQSQHIDGTADVSITCRDRLQETVRTPMTSMMQVITMSSVNRQSGRLERGRERHEEEMSGVLESAGDTE